MDHSIYFVLVRYDQENLDKVLPSLNGMQVVEQFQLRKDKYILKYTPALKYRPAKSDRIVVIFCETWEQENIYLAYAKSYSLLHGDNPHQIYSMDLNKVTQIFAENEKEADENVKFYLEHYQDTYFFPNIPFLDEKFKEAGFNSYQDAILKDPEKYVQSQ